MTRTSFVSLALLSLAACGGGDNGGQSTTKLDAVEVQPGSISDSMIILDDATGDGTAVDNSVPDDGTAKKGSETDEKGENATEPVPAAEADENPEAVDMPAAKKAAPSSAAKKAE